MKIARVTLRQLRMRLKAPFATSFGSFLDKDFLLVEVTDTEGTSGWESPSPFPRPGTMRKQ